ncbi:type VII secretion integral membrane protein EccD [Micromonospora polyrhachis]
MPKLQTTKVGLTRIVLLSPQRRADLAVPGYLPLVNLQPALLRHAGVGLADEGLAHHGWVLRRTDGTLLDPNRSLTGQNVTDGETVLLAPQDQQWPEPEYDDLADAVAHEVRLLGAAWSGEYTRRAGAVTMMVALVGGLLVALRGGPDWTVAGIGLAVLALVALTVAAVAARALRDAGTALLLSIASYAYLGLGAALLGTGAARIGRAQLLVAGAALAWTAVAALIAVGTHRVVHVAVLGGGVLGAVGALLAMVTSPAAAAGILAGALLLGSPWLPRLAARQGGLPAPTVPNPSSEAPVDEPLPSPERISAIVARSDGLLTSLLWAMCTALAGCATVLARQDDVSARLLAAAIVVVCALRARAFVAVRHRVPLLAAALASGLALLVFGWAGVDPASHTRYVTTALAVVVLAAAGAYLVGRKYAAQPPGPQLGRLADITEYLLLALSGVLAILITGLVGYMRGLGG